jgi:hypothetical protein
VWLVYGNDGYDVVCDASGNMDSVLAGADKLSKMLEGRRI